MSESQDVQNDAAKFAAARSRMIQDHLGGRGITDVRVLEAMNRVPREQFVPDHLRGEAYADRPLPIGLGQTISQPFTTAYMTQALRLQGTEKVLEVGTGSGYAAAILSCLAREVVTVERISALADQARDRLARLGFDNVHVVAADGTLGMRANGPFDAIVVTAGSDRLPPPYAEQLSEAGRIVIPIGNTPTSQILHHYTRQGDQLTVEELGRFAFVPLIGEHGWSEMEF